MRRGLSTVSGALFFMVAATATIAYISYTTNSIENFAQSIIVKDTQSIDRLKEDIEITTVTLTDTNKFNMTVLNKGSIPTKLVRLWVTDQSSNPITHNRTPTHLCHFHIIHPFRICLVWTTHPGHREHY